MLHPSDRLNEFHRALGDFVDSCARLDVTVCWQLASWKEFDPRGVRASLRKTVSFNERVSKLRSLCEAVSDGVSEDARLTMVRWFTELDRVRQLRNEYCHGRWITPPKEGPRGLEIQFVSLEHALAESTELVTVRLSDLEQLSAAAKGLISDCLNVLGPFLDRSNSTTQQKRDITGNRP